LPQEENHGIIEGRGGKPVEKRTDRAGTWLVIIGLVLNLIPIALFYLYPAFYPESSISLAEEIILGICCADELLLLVGSALLRRRSGLFRRALLLCTLMLVLTLADQLVVGRLEHRTVEPLWRIVLPCLFEVLYALAEFGFLHTLLPGFQTMAEGETVRRIDSVLHLLKIVHILLIASVLLQAVAELVELQLHPNFPLHMLTAVLMMAVTVLEVAAKLMAVFQLFRLRSREST